LCINVLISSFLSILSFSAQVQFSIVCRYSCLKKSMNNKERYSPSPCIGFCSTTYGDDICRGCYREVKEVLQWRELALENKADYYEQVAYYAESFLKDKVTIIDPNLFEDLCKRYKIYSIEGISPYYFLLRLFQKGILSHLDQETCLMKNVSLSWSDLYRFVDRDIFKAREHNFQQRENGYE